MTEVNDTDLSSLGINIISGKIAEYLDGTPSGCVGIIDPSSKEELISALHKREDVLMCNDGVDAHLLSLETNSFKMLASGGAKMIERVELSIPNANAIYVLDGNKNGLSAWATMRAFEIAKHSHVIAILGKV